MSFGNMHMELYVREKNPSDAPMPPDMEHSAIKQAAASTGFPVSGGVFEFQEKNNTAASGNCERKIGSTS
ncbi:hypothetical protein [Victivallis vadensis]|jgi:hypothetical protein|uniref:Uncharacterized protein n=1 Tax=Victivallis vadensis TaxID=172901 RepID=A0A848B1V8_9BACT|nr:hypothetical protein [Victivallis vadensis]NMD87720.1 hypothetical protein [Victivallis vadensis]